MMFLALFSTLAIGFSTSTNTAAQVSENDHRIANAQLATESGMDFMRYQLAQITIPAGTPQNQILPTVAAGLSSQLTGTRNMGTMTVGYTSRDTKITIPSLSSQYIALDNNN